MKFNFSLALLIFSSNLYSQSGADALLEATGSDVEISASAPVMAAEKKETRFKLTDPFLQSLFVEWKANGTQSFELNRWMGLILSHDFEAASHLWSSVQSHLSSDFQGMASITWAYLNWKLNLPQTFISSWREAKIKAGSSRLFLALEQTLAEGKSAEWIQTNKPYINPNFAQELLGANDGFSLELSAWAHRHNTKEAMNVLQKLPLGHPRSFDLATAAVLTFARERKLGEAGKLLKRRVEPELNKLGDAKLLARHYLALGRLLYQSGALEAAEAFYAKVPRGIPEFLPARTERTWVLLRLGRIAELRGELESLSHKILSDRFLPEVSLVRSISNLKLCLYDEVAKDFKFFIENNQKWAKKIASALESLNTPLPDIYDPRVNNAQESLKIRIQEEERLAILVKKSIKAALPAIGEQAHWIKARDNVISSREEMKRILMAESRRFWKNREIILAEAIRKMKFVKVETMAQVRTIAKTQSNLDTISTIQSASGKQTYPFDGVYWPDELFTLQAKAQTRCSGGK